MATDEQRTAVRGQRKLSQLELMNFYTDFKDFRKYMYRGIDKMPRWIKDSEGQECIHAIKQSLRYLSVVARTYDKPTKVRNIDLFLTEWDVVADSISFFAEVKGIDSHQRQVMCDLKYRVEEQVSALRTWLMNNAEPLITQ